MSASRKFLLVIGIVFVGFFVATPVFMTIFELSRTKLTLLSNAGVMIESKGFRLYADPFYLSSGYELPADVVCITHPHNDHYIPQSVTSLQKEGTINIFPETMTDAITLFDGVGLSPGDQIVVSDEITITAHYLYTDEFFHPPENNWTSYIIDIDGFVFFIAGDSDNIPEYQQLTGLIDVAIFNYVPGTLMIDEEVVDAINTIDPQYVMLAHATIGETTDFYDEYGSQFDATFLNLDHYTSHRF